MKLNRKGDIGFMEAMAGAMTVCLVMTAFTAFLVADTLATGPEPPEFDWGLIGDVSIKDGTFSAEPDCTEYPESNRVPGILVRIYSPAFDSIGTFEELFGSESDNSVCQRKMVSVENDGTSVPAVMEAVIFL